MLTTPQPYGGVTSFGPMSPADPVTASISQKDLVIQLRQFAQDPNHQFALIQNMECLKTLTEVLSTAISAETCIIALQTIHLLAVNPKHRPTLRKIPKLLPRLQLLKKSKNMKISMLASNLLEILNSNYVNQKQQTYQPRPLHTVHLKIVNLKTVSDRDDIQKIGIAVSGVISVSANMQSQHVTFYCTRADIEPKLVRALRTKGFQIQDDSDEKTSVYLDDSNAKSYHTSPQRPKPSHNNQENIAQQRSTAVGGMQPKTKLVTPERTDTQSLRVRDPSFNNTGASYVEATSYSSKTALAKYEPDPTVKTLSQRLEEERQQRELTRQRQEETESSLSRFISYFW